AYLADVEVGMETDAALGRPTRDVVVPAPPREHLDAAVVHADGHGDLEDPLRGPQQAVDVRVDPRELGRVVESFEEGSPRVVPHDPMVPYAGASVTPSACSSWS